MLNCKSITVFGNEFMLDKERIEICNNYDSHHDSSLSPYGYALDDGECINVSYGCDDIEYMAIFKDWGKHNVIVYHKCNMETISDFNKEDVIYPVYRFCQKCPEAFKGENNIIYIYSSCNRTWDDDCVEVQVFWDVQFNSELTDFSDWHFIEELSLSGYSKVDSTLYTGERWDDDLEIVRKTSKYDSEEDEEEVWDDDETWEDDE